MNKNDTKICPDCKCPCQPSQEYCICGHKFNEIDFLSNLFGFKNEKDKDSPVQ